MGVLDQHRRGETRGLPSFENGGGDVRGEVGEAENLAVVGSVQFSLLARSANFPAPPCSRFSLNRWALTIALIRLGSGFAGGANGSVLVDHHPDFLAGAAQPAPGETAAELAHQQPGPGWLR